MYSKAAAHAHVCCRWPATLSERSILKDEALCARERKKSSISTDDGTWHLAAFQIGSQEDCRMVLVHQAGMLKQLVAPDEHARQMASQRQEGLQLQKMAWDLQMERRLAVFVERAEQSPSHRQCQ